MVLAKILSLPNLYKSSSSKNLTGTYYYINSEIKTHVRRLCPIILKIIPKEYCPKVGDIANIRDATGKKQQITIIQHDRPINKPVELVFSYHKFGMIFTDGKVRDIFPPVILKPQEGVVHSWSEYEEGSVKKTVSIKRYYHFFVLSRPMKLQFYFPLDDEVEEIEVGESVTHSKVFDSVNPPSLFFTCDITKKED